MLDLSILSTPTVIEQVDFEAILEEIKADLIDRFPAIEPVLQLESSVAVMVMQACAYREVLLRARINDASARSNLIAFATGSDLDHQAAFYGVTRLPNETDSALRSRVVLAIQGRSAGGTEERYAFVARSADVRVRDVAVYRVNDGPKIRIAIRSTDNGGVPTNDILAAVLAAVTASDVAIVSDVIEVVAGVSDVVNVAATIWLLPDAPAALFDALPGILRAAWEAESGMGFDLNLSWVKARLHVPGVSRVDVTAPMASVVVDDNHAVAIGTINLTMAGRSR